MNKASVIRQGNQGEKGYRAPNTRNYVQCLSGGYLVSKYPKLFFSIIFFFGMSLFIIGVRLIFRNHPWFTPLIGWWLVVFGTMLVLGPLSMFIAQWLASFDD